MDVVNDVLWINRFALGMHRPIEQVDSLVIRDRWHMIGVTVVIVDVSGQGSAPSGVGVEDGQ
jgi:hypothetical protein